MFLADIFAIIHIAESLIQTDKIIQFCLGDEHVPDFQLGFQAPADPATKNFVKIHMVKLSREQEICIPLIRIELEVLLLIFMPVQGQELPQQ